MVTEEVYDLMSSLFDVTYCSLPIRNFPECHEAGSDQCGMSAEFQQRREKFISQLDRRLQTFEIFLPAEGFVGGKLSYSDCALFELLDQLLIFAPQCLCSFPRLRVFHSNFALIPEVHAYRQSKRFKVEPLHNRYSHFHEGWVPSNSSENPHPLAHLSGTFDVDVRCTEYDVDLRKPRFSLWPRCQTRSMSQIF